MKKALLLLANGFEEIEALTPVDVLRRAGVVVTLAAVEDNPVTSARGVKILADKLLSEVNTSEYDIVILPGGGGGAEIMKGSNAVLKIVQEFAENKLVGAICAGPMVLDKAGVIKEHKVTCYPGCEENFVKNYIEKSVVESENIITSRGPGTALEFSLTLAKILVGEEQAKEVAKAMVVKYI